MGWYRVNSPVLENKNWIRARSDWNIARAKSSRVDQQPNVLHPGLVM